MELVLFLKGLSYLAGIILLIYGLFHFVPKSLKSFPKKPSSYIEIIEYKRLDQKHAISLVSVDKIRLLLVTGPSSICVQQIVAEQEAPFSMHSKPNQEIH